MKVLLIPPKHNYPDTRPSIDVFGQGFPYIAGALLQAGHQVFAVNTSYRWFKQEASVELRQSIQQALLAHQPDLIGVGGQSADYRFIHDTIESMRELSPDVPIVCGGGIITYDQEYIFQDLKPDFAISGDAESNIVNLADCLENHGDLSSISNLAYWNGDQAIFNSRCFPNSGLDNIPWPSYEPFDFETYLEAINQADHFFAHTRPNPRVLPITLGRSCPFRCTFCCHTTGPKYRQRSIADAILEIRHFYNTYHFNILLLYDELFSTDRERISEFCRQVKQLKREGIDFDWTVGLRVANMDPEILQEMKESGCIFIGYGLESASPAVLKSMNKGVKVEQIRRSIEITTAAGIGVQGNFIFGDFAETADTLAETMTFFSRHCRDLIVHLGLLTPFPGSQIFTNCLESGLIQDKKYYYENIGVIGTYRINMSQIPDNDFFDLMESVANLTSPYLPKLLILKEADVVSCEPMQQYGCDLRSAAPLQEQRQVYDVQVTCPHCHTRAKYDLPLAIRQIHDEITKRLYCPSCHKRFNVRIHIQVPDDEPVRTPRLCDLLDHRQLKYCLNNALPYFGMQVGPLQKSPRQYSCMDLMVKSLRKSSPSEPLRILEIGSGIGGSAITWATALKKYHHGAGIVTCVDSWGLNPQICDSTHADENPPLDCPTMTSTVECKDLLELFTHNILSTNINEFVTTMQGTSDQVLPLLAGCKFDLIFLGNDHSYKSIMKELHSATEILDDGGLLCGNGLELRLSQIEQDCAQIISKEGSTLTQEYLHPDIPLAVNEYFGETSTQAGLWYMRKTGTSWEQVDLPAIFNGALQLPAHFCIPDGFSPVPILSEEGYFDFNIIQYGDLFIGLSWKLGHVDTLQLKEDTLKEYQNSGLAVAETSLNAARRAIKKIANSSPMSV